MVKRKDQSYLATHRYVRYLVFGTAALLGIVALSMVFGDTEVFSFLMRLSEKWGLIDPLLKE